VLRMDVDRNDAAKGRVAYEMSLTDDGGFSRSGQPNNSNIASFSGRMVIRGFDIEDAPGIDSGGDIAGVPKNEVVDRGFVTTEDGTDLDRVEQVGLSSTLVVRSIKSPGPGGY